MRLNEPVTQKDINYSSDVKLVTITDLRGYITYANDDFVKLSGYSREELIGQNHNLIRHPDMPEGAFANLWDTIQNGQSWRGVVKNRAKSGDHYWVDAYVTPIKHQGKIIEYQSIRVKPSEHARQRAEQAYAAWKKTGQPPAVALKKGLSLTSKNLLALLLPGLVVLGLLGWQQHWTALVSVLALLLVSGTALLANGRSLSPLQVEAAQITDSTLMSYIYTGTTHDIGRIRYALQTRTAELRAVATRLADTSTQLAQSKDRSDSLLQKTDIAIQEAGSHVQVVAQTMGAMLQSQQRVTDASARTSEAAASSQQATLEGKKQLTAMIDAISHLAQTLEQARSRVADLSQQTSRIGTVIDVITDVAEQTNLLALNAAIEAARAGEAGRGFAVVADEVRSLAQRTHHSTNEIRSIIDGLISDTEASVAAIEKGSKASNETVKLAQETDTALEGVLSTVAHINELALEVDSTMQEQTTLSHQTEHEMQVLEQSANTVEAVSQESRAEAQQLANQVETLHRLAKHFIASITAPKK